MQINQTIQKQTTQQNCIITISTKKTNQPTFEYIIIQAVDAAFSTLNNKQDIFCQLETKYGLSLFDIADNPKAFAAAIKEMFGEASPLIELKILTELYSKAPNFKYRLGKNQKLTLSGYLQKMKKYCS